MAQLYSPPEQVSEASGGNVHAAKSYALALEAVRQLPLPLLTSLLHEIANRIGQQASAVAISSSGEDPKRNSLKLLLGRMKTSQPPPTDEKLAPWLDEHLWPS